MKIIQTQKPLGHLPTIATALLAGQIIALPTDTIYGLHCLATDAKAVAKLYRLKHRDEAKPCIILVNSLTMLKKYCRVTAPQSAELKKIWLTNRAAKDFRPTTVILPRRDNLPSLLSNPANCLAVRLPNNLFLRKLISTVGQPLVSTSFNHSGQPIWQSLAEGVHKFRTPQANLLLYTGELIGQPSQILDFSRQTLKIIRA